MIDPSSYDFLQSAPAETVLRWGLHHFNSRLAVVTSFQREGMVLLDMAVRLSPAVRIATIDTGRLPAETLAMIDAVERRYGMAVERWLPDEREVAAMTQAHGPDLFRDGVPLRRLCCEVRKVRVLARARQQLDAWVVGLRRGQADSRSGVAKVSQEDGLLKLSPLADWSEQQVLAYTREHSLPEHPLYRQGYRSIGCGPCTRAVDPDEPERAGRWWWEQDTAAECGLHFRPDGKAERTVDVLLREVLTRARA